MTSFERRNRPQSIDVLVVDDEDDIRELLELSLMRMGLACDSAGTVQAARELAEANDADLELASAGPGAHLVLSAHTRP